MSKRLAAIALYLALWTGSYPALAQDTRNVPRLGVLMATSAQNETGRLGVFRKELAELGYIESKNIHLEYRFADGKLDRFPQLVSELVRAKVNIIVTAGNEAIPLRPSQSSWHLAVIPLEQYPLESAFRGLGCVARV